MPNFRYFVPTVEQARGLREVAPREREIASIQRIPSSPEVESILSDLILKQERAPGVPATDWARGLTEAYVAEGSIPPGMRRVIETSPQRGASWLHGDRGLDAERMSALESALSRARANWVAGEAQRAADVASVSSRPDVPLIPVGEAPSVSSQYRMAQQREAASAEALRRRLLAQEIQQMSESPQTIESALSRAALAEE